MKHYVYIYRDPRPEMDRQPIYVGKGKGKRVDDHWSGGKCHNIQLLLELIKYRQMGLEPIREIVAYFDNEKDAFSLEKEMIAKFGRRDLGSGTLTNEHEGGCGGFSHLTYEQRAVGGRSRKGEPRSPEVRAKIAATLRGRKLPPEHVAKLAKASRGRVKSPETRAKLSTANKGKAPSPKCLEAGAAANRGRSLSQEHRDKLSASSAVRGKPAWNRGLKQSPETLAKKSAALKGRQPWNKGKPETKEHRAAVSAGLRGSPVGPSSPERRAKMSAVHRGKPKSAEHRAKIGAANRGKTRNAGRPKTPEQRAKLSAAAKARWARSKGSTEEQLTLEGI